MKEIEIKDFELYTAGIISVAWNDGKEDKFINVDLDLSMMLQMIDIEGLSHNDVKKICDSQKPLTFHKVRLVIFEEDGREGSYYTSDIFDEEDDPVVFHAEIKK